MVEAIVQGASRRYLSLIAVVILGALVLRLVAAMDYGRDWRGPNTFTHINFDEASACRAVLGAHPYAAFVGYQTLALARWFGTPPPAESYGDARRAKAYCHSREHLGIARAYSAVLGSLTVPVLFMLALQLFPGRYDVALGSAVLLTLSGWHISESLTGTVDAASTFFIYLFIGAVAWARRVGPVSWPIVFLLLVATVWTKYWVFAVFGLIALLSPSMFARVFASVSARRIGLVTIVYAGAFACLTMPVKPGSLPWLVVPIVYLFVPWRALPPAGRVLFLLLPWVAPLAMNYSRFMEFTSGYATSSLFGTHYGAIGWHKLLRNPLNIPIVTLMGLGLPAATAVALGTYRLWKEQAFDDRWLPLLPVGIYLLYMLFLAPVTYYRHYLPLLPALCLLAAFGLSSLSVRWRRAGWVLAVCWQLSLAVDLATDFHFDPRRELPSWYAQARPERVLASYYVNPPPTRGTRHALFRVRDQDNAFGGLERYWRRADTLILSENWYDTAFPNELNGPLARDPAKLIKTTPKAVAFYRQALADEHPRLQKVAHFRAPTFMPELLVHRALYGSFTQFVGDIVVYRIVP